MEGNKGNGEQMLALSKITTQNVPSKTVQD